MKTAFFLTGLLALAGCATSAQQPLAAKAITDDKTAVVIPPKAVLFTDIPLKPMTASQSAARMN